MNAMQLNITTSKPFIYNNVPYHEGILRINNFEEKFIVPLDNWTLGDYQQQWIEGLERIHFDTTSCIVTAVQDPTVRPLINWWILYKHHNKIYVRNELLFSHYYFSIIGHDIFTPQNCYEFIGSRQHYFDETINVAEWVIDITSETYDHPLNIHRKYFA
jgi:hypothetical protein